MRQRITEYIWFGLRHHPNSSLRSELQIHSSRYMWQDPIVQDVRKAGEELAKQANYDLHTFFQNLRNNEKKRNYKVVSRLKEEVTFSKTPDVR